MQQTGLAQLSAGEQLTVLVQKLGRDSQELSISSAGAAER
jgi:hypothetical protein